MATEDLKSTRVTNLDANPIVENTIGEGAEGYMRVNSGTASSTAGMLTGSTYRMVRIPTNAKVKQVLLNTAAHGGSAAFDINVAYSDATTDNPSSGAIIQISAADNKLFGAAVAVASAQAQKDVTLGTFTPAMQNKPLWQALIDAGTTEFTADPGGFFDIVLKSTATDTSGGLLAIEVRFVV